MEKAIRITRTVLESILAYAQGIHPREGILLLQGKTSKEYITINNTVIPPFAVHGDDYSSFSLFHLPLDPYIVGVAHSHPSGELIPSITDLNFFYGKIMIIVGYPYSSDRDVSVFNREGAPVKYEVIPD